MNRDQSPAGSAGEPVAAVGRDTLHSASRTKSARCDGHSAFLVFGLLVVLAVGLVTVFPDLGLNGTSGLATLRHQRVGD